MGVINIKNILFEVDREKFLEVERKALSDLVSITMQQKVKDEIFSIIKRGENLHLLRFPIEEDELCAFTVIKKGRGFIYINTHQNLNLQVFAAAHEIYHLKYDLTNAGEVLKDVESQFNGTISEMMANSYAACFLVPKSLLEQHIDLMKIDRSNISLVDVLVLMDAFAVPFKAMVLRLYETQVISDEQAELLLQNTTSEIKLLAKQKQIGLKWLKTDNEIEYSNLNDLALNNFTQGSMTTFKILKDFKEFEMENDIKELLSELEP